MFPQNRRSSGCIHMQRVIGTEYRDTLQQAQDCYDAIVTELEKDIQNLCPLDKEIGDTAYNALLEKLNQYTERKGDTDRISNFIDLPAIKEELDEGAP